MFAPRINKGPFVSLESFQFYGSGRFAGDIVEDAVDPVDLIDDAVHGGLEDLPGDVGGLGGHEVTGDDGAEDDGQAIGPVVAHDADAMHVGEGGEVLTQSLVCAGLVQLLTEDVVGLGRSGPCRA